MLSVHRNRLACGIFRKSHSSSHAQSSSTTRLLAIVSFMSVFFPDLKFMQREIPNTLGIWIGDCVNVPCWRKLIHVYLLANTLQDDFSLNLLSRISLVVESVAKSNLRGYPEK